VLAQKVLSKFRLEIQTMFMHRPLSPVNDFCIPPLGRRRLTPVSFELLGALFYARHYPEVAGISGSAVAQLEQLCWSPTLKIYKK
jgi:hypothetical protein